MVEISGYYPTSCREHEYHKVDVDVVEVEKKPYVYMVNVLFHRCEPYDNVSRTIYIYSNDKLDEKEIADRICKDAEENAYFNLPQIGRLVPSWIKAFGDIAIEFCDYKWGNESLFNVERERVVGFYIYLWGNDNKYPQRAVIVKGEKVVEVIPETSGYEDFDETIWCGHCIEQGTECEFCREGNGIPECFSGL